jgi:adenylosuccinate synthase
LGALLREFVSVQLVLGTQWGDEGKGKVVDLLGKNADIVARFQGGPNAGHTVKYNNETFILHMIPTGILRSHIQCIIGNGVVINPKSFLEEVQDLEKRGIEVRKRLFISQNAHFILPYHQLVEKAAEESKTGEKIGTTGRGIGPAYADKSSRLGIRVGDLLDGENWKARVSQIVRSKNRILESVYHISGVDEKEVLDCLRTFFDKFKNCIVDTTWKIHEAIRQGKRIILEGAQGTLLDIDFGTYPFVTSSNTTVGGVSTGLGVGPRKIDRIIGILKAYTTRVGNGPFPTELAGTRGEEIRKIGGEYGATTGRPRRCGWLDTVIARYAIQLSDIDVMAITKLDVLDSLKEIKICTRYQYQGKMLTHFPTDCRILDEAKPVYEVLPGWQEPISGIRKYEDLPKSTKQYLKRIEELTKVPIGMVSVGPTREATIWI